MKSTLQETKSIIGLSLSLAVANFKVRNEGSFLGLFWYLLDPLTFFFVLFSVSENLLQNPIDQYPLYLLIGLIMFNFFNAVTTFSTQVISNNSGLVKSLKIKSEAFVFSVVLQFIFSHIFELIVLIIFAIIFKADIGWLIFYPFIFFFFAVFTTGISLALAVWGVHVGDLRNVWSVFSRMLWFATPIFYSLEEAGTIKTINIWNPLYYFINTAREVVIYQRNPAWTEVILIVCVSVLTLLVGLAIFEKFKGGLAEKI